MVRCSGFFTAGLGSQRTPLDVVNSAVIVWEQVAQPEKQPRKCDTLELIYPGETQLPQEQACGPGGSLLCTPEERAPRGINSRRPGAHSGRGHERFPVFAELVLSALH